MLLIVLMLLMLMLMCLSCVVVWSAALLWHFLRVEKSDSQYAGVEVKVVGVDRFNKGEATILMPNHSSGISVCYRVPLIVRVCVRASMCVCACVCACVCVRV